MLIKKSSMDLKSVLNNQVGKVLARARYDDLLYLFLELGVGTLAAFVPPVGAVAIYISTLNKKTKFLSKTQLENSFYYFKKNGWIDIEYRNGKTSICLSTKGKNKAELLGAGKILSDKLNNRVKWDGKWRMVIFDLGVNKNRERGAIRIMLKRCGFLYLQKSVWIYPHDCQEEINFLRSFFKLSDNEFRLIISDNVGEDYQMIKHFSLKY